MSKNKDPFVNNTGIPTIDNAKILYSSYEPWFSSTGSKLLLAGFGMVGAVGLYNSYTIVPAGHVGVYDLFGNVKDQHLGTGFHLKNPFANVILFNTKIETYDMDVKVPSKEGLSIDLQISSLVHLDPAKATQIYKNVGTNYIEKLFFPHLKSTVRDTTSSFDAKALYTSDSREEISNKINDNLNDILNDVGIIVEATPLKSVELPYNLKNSIEAKLQAEQESQRMQWVLAKEKLEAERKKIEATGIAEFQAIVTQGISDKLLQWKGIEATKDLALSTNSKIVIVGGKDGLPIILNSNK